MSNLAKYEEIQKIDLTQKGIKECFEKAMKEGTKYICIAFKYCECEPEIQVIFPSKFQQEYNKIKDLYDENLQYNGLNYTEKIIAYTLDYNGEDMLKGIKKLIKQYEEK